MEPTSIALGVLQVTCVVINLSLFLHKKIKVFRKYSREVGRVFKGIRRQRINFIHEIHLLLRLATQHEKIIERMLQNTEDRQWNSKELQDGLDSALPGNLDTVKDIMEDFKSTLDVLNDELACFNAIEKMGAKDEHLKHTVRRVRNGVTVTWNKESWEGHIKTLRDLNDDLRHLREQAAEIKEPVFRGKANTRPIHQLSPEYGSIGKVRSASHAFHQALATAWLKEISETQSQRIRHNVKLKLDTQVENEVKMEVMIACYECTRLQPIPIQDGFMNLYVESRVLDLTKSGLNTPPTSSDDRGRKKRRVCFDLDDDKQNSTTVSNVTAAQDQGKIDLRDTQSICTALQGTSVDSFDSKCLGYLDSCGSEAFRHSFFGMASSRSIPESISVSTEQILSYPPEEFILLVDQLRLARSFAMAVLKFHSTPWLTEYVSIRDICFFRFEDSDMSSFIPTAHLDFNFIQTSTREDFPIPTVDMVNREAIEDSRLAHGIRNLTLWGLGTIMLQIGTWSTLKSLYDVVAVRRLAQRVPVLGKRYRDLTKQCLECDFGGVGDDLSQPRLHRALYEHVVCGLTDMIEALDVEEN